MPCVFIICVVNEPSVNCYIRFLMLNILKGQKIKLNFNQFWSRVIWFLAPNVKCSYIELQGFLINVYGLPFLLSNIIK